MYHSELEMCITVSWKGVLQWVGKVITVSWKGVLQ